MRVTLVHNPVAGDADHTGSALAARVRSAGHDVTYTSTEAERLSHALREPADVVLAAGGDGTIAAVVRLIAASNRVVPFAILPMGTANNIARSMGVSDDLEQILRGLDSAERRPLDVAMVRAAWGTTKFVESAGVGAFAATLSQPSVDDPASEAGAADPNAGRRGNRLRRSLEAMQPRDWRIDADGDDLSGSYLLVMVLNIGLVGPGLALAPSADPGDRQLDLLLVEERHRETLGVYLAAIAQNDERTLGIPTRTVSNVRLEWSMAHGHVDDRRWPELSGGSEANETGVAEIAVAGPPIQVLVPSR